MMKAVTRIEIADVVRSAFDRNGANRTDLLRVAESNQARPQVLAALAELPERRYGAMNDLWEHIGRFPIDA